MSTPSRQLRSFRCARIYVICSITSTLLVMLLVTSPMGLASRLCLPHSQDAEAALAKRSMQSGWHACLKSETSRASRHLWEYPRVQSDDACWNMDSVVLEYLQLSDNSVTMARGTSFIMPSPLCRQDTRTLKWTLLSLLTWKFSPTSAVVCLLALCFLVDNILLANNSELLTTVFKADQRKLSPIGVSIGEHIM
jgi:hypothetical protein